MRASASAPDLGTCMRPGERQRERERESARDCFRSSVNFRSCVCARGPHTQYLGESECARRRCLLFLDGQLCCAFPLAPVRPTLCRCATRCPAPSLAWPTLADPGKRLWPPARTCVHSWRAHSWVASPIIHLWTVSLRLYFQLFARNGTPPDRKNLGPSCQMAREAVNADQNSSARVGTPCARAHWAYERPAHMHARASKRTRP